MSIWEFMQAIDGWKMANGVEDKPEPPSVEEFHDMVARLS